MQKKRNYFLIGMISFILIWCGLMGNQFYLKSHYDLAQGELPQRLRAYEGSIITDVILIHNNQGDAMKLLQIAHVPGYAAPITLKVIISFADRQIIDLEILKHQESHDYGAYLTEPWFIKRFVDQHVSTPLKLQKMSAQHPGDVVAITGATITSQAIIDAVNVCRENYLTIEEELK